MFLNRVTVISLEENFLTRQSSLHSLFQNGTFYQDGQIGKQILLPFIILDHHFWATFLKFSFLAARTNACQQPFHLSVRHSLFFVVWVRADHCCPHEGRLKVRAAAWHRCIPPAETMCTLALQLHRFWEVDWTEGQAMKEGRGAGQEERRWRLLRVESTRRCEEHSQKSS